MRKKMLVSSHLEAVSYNQRKRKLRVWFKREQSVYEYDVPLVDADGVKEGVALAIVQAESAGKWFNQHVRLQYPYRRVR